MAQVTDKVLIRLAKAGSSKAFESLVKKYHPFVSRFAYGLLGDADIVQDISQNVFIKFYENLNTFKITDAKLSTWLCKVARNMCLNHIKFNQRFVTLDSEVPGRGFEESADCKLDLFNALKGLDSEHRQTFLLVKLGGLSYEEVAQVMDIPIGTVKSRVYKAREMLVKKLGASYKKEMV